MLSSLRVCPTSRLQHQNLQQNLSTNPQCLHAPKMKESFWKHGCSGLVVDCWRDKAFIGSHLPRHHRSLDWRQNLEVLADRLKPPPQPDYGQWPPPPVHLTASSSVRDIALPAPLLPAPVLAPLQPERQLSTAPSFDGISSRGRKGPGGQSPSRQPPADDQAILTQHAAAINASLTTAGSRLAVSSGGSRSSRPGKHVAPPLSEAGLSEGGTTASMHSATSGRGSSNNGGSRASGLPPPPVQSPTADAGEEFEDESLLDGGVDSSGIPLGQQLQLGQTPAALDRGWNALRRYMGR